MALYLFGAGLGIRGELRQLREDLRQIREREARAHARAQAERDQHLKVAQELAQQLSELRLQNADLEDDWGALETMQAEHGDKLFDVADLVADLARDVESLADGHSTVIVEKYGPGTIHEPPTEPTVGG